MKNEILTTIITNTNNNINIKWKDEGGKRLVGGY